MVTSIIVLVLSTTLLGLQYFRQDRRSWTAAMVLIPMLMLASGFNIYEEMKAQKFSMITLEKMATRINWSESRLKANFHSEPQKVSNSEVTVQVKIYSKRVTDLPLGIDFDSFYQQCDKDEVFGYSHLPPSSAEKLFHAYQEADGSIYDKKEEVAKVERFYYVGGETTATDFDPTVMLMELIKGANVNSVYTSLADLNGSIIVGRLSTNSEIWPTSLQWELKSSAGQLLLYMPFKFIKNQGSQSISKYVGVCFPQQYFWSSKEL